MKEVDRVTDQTPFQIMLNWPVKFINNINNSPTFLKVVLSVRS